MTEMIDMSTIELQVHPDPWEILTVFNCDHQILAADMIKKGACPICGTKGVKGKIVQCPDCNQIRLGHRSINHAYSRCKDCGKVHHAEAQRAYNARIRAQESQTVDTNSSEIVTLKMLKIRANKSKLITVERSDCVNRSKCCSEYATLKCLPCYGCDQYEPEILDINLYNNRSDSFAPTHIGWDGYQ